MRHTLSLRGILALHLLRPDRRNEPCYLAAKVHDALRSKRDQRKAMDVQEGKLCSSRAIVSIHLLTGEP